ncbi:MAG TPA: type II toxin-antitoxin system VapC family toxin [Agitococcus sp.]|nr:type II toxin-antitoxin system VapC family toxin [Agitococcus sp.]HMY29228.1 type II toxin-antitoxin system VapC family toxin [Agitococcus sp.]HNC87135.1 type II toxin-antitoxin system VapC family toxin [Agitococcus sp.]HNJ85460.1 type II toxin-antitoxin system VapC family toxin [Agitococcus sp.]HNL81101.1 type II toxin-antitoxin system VapC family toxin [Agitococcus sp.]
MNGLDTNILARYYIEDAGDSESLKQRLLAQKIIEAGTPLMVCKTVILEFEWVMRGYYQFSAQAISTVFNHLLSLSHVQIEDRDLVQKAVTYYLTGLDFADALHHASYQTCTQMLSFDDRRFARKVKKMALLPPVIVPK